jgi:N-acetylneuraminic acid mutarotase
MGYVTCGYVGGLSVVTDQVWAYNPGINQWIAMEDFKGTSRRFPVGFAVDNKGYYGTGTNGANFNDFWQYNPAINSTFENTEVDINYFPNPSTDFVTFQKESYSVINRIQLINNLGALVLQKDLTNDIEQISVDAFPAGVYQILFYNQNVLIGSQKISVQK